MRSCGVTVVFDRVRLRRHVYDELHNVRAYRQTLKKPGAVDAKEADRMRAWIRTGDDLLSTLRSEPDGDRKSRFADDLFGITHRTPGNARYVYSRTVAREHVSYPGVKVWRDNALFIASVLAVRHGAIDLSSDQ